MSYDYEEERSDTAAAIDKYGWHAILVKGDDDGPPFAYTIGLHTTYRHPEVLLYGLNDLKFMHKVLALMKGAIACGERYEPGREYAEILKDSRCTFLPIPSAAYDEYLCAAQRFYEGNAFDALQCIWPEHGQRFPWDAKASPDLLACEPVLAQRNGRRWQFSALAKYRYVVTTTQVLTEADPIIRVIHDDDGWQFLGGGGADGVVVCVGNLVDRDATLEEVADLPKRWSAWRDRIGAPWQRICYDDGS
jgi:hypothetical protein